MTEGVRRIFHVLVLFAIARLVLGVALIVVFDRGAVAWGREATFIVVGVGAVYALVGFAVSRRTT